jgi:hypothetical protein
VAVAAAAAGTATAEATAEAMKAPKLHASVPASVEARQRRQCSMNAPVPAAAVEARLRRQR